MKKHWKAILLGLFLVLALIFIFSKQIGMLFSKPKTNPDGSPVANSSAFPLKIGSTGVEVKKLQTWLNKKFSNILSTDGIFGPITLAALFAATGSKEVSETFFNSTVLRDLEIMAKTGGYTYTWS